MSDILYTNFVQIRAAFFDVTLTLNRVSDVVEKDGENQPVVEELARVQMSPQHAKALLGALETTMRGYEERFGRIEIPNLDADRGSQGR